MRSTFGKAVRRSGAVAAVVAYAAPLALGLATGTVHAAGHAVQFLSAERDRLVAIGLVHEFGPAPLQEASTTRGFTNGEASAGAFVHEHGGSPHSHGTLLGGALGESLSSVGQEEGSASAAGLAFHLPAPCEMLCGPRSHASADLDSNVRDLRGVRPPPALRPPRV